MRQPLRHCRFSAVGLLIAWLILWIATNSGAQEPPTPAAPTADKPAAAPATDAPKPTLPAAGEPLVGEVLPRVFFLPDKDGKLQAVPGFGLEEFRELYDLKHQLAAQNRPPAYSISKIELSGTATAQRAELLADVTIGVNEAGWIRVPLRMETAMLHEPATFDGPGEHLVDVAADGSGYVVWIRSEPNSTHHVKLRLWAPVSQAGAETHLQLNVPRAAISRLQLQVPLEKATVRVSEGSTLESAAAVDGKTQIAVVGVASDFELAWLPSDTPVAQLPTVLEATGAVSVRIDGRTVSSEAKLTVRSSGGEFDSFRVRLPPGAEYVPSPQVGATVSTSGKSGDGGQLCDVKLARKTTGPVEVRLFAQRPFQPTRDTEPVELAGFEVVDAVRQFGTLVVQAVGNWQLQWTQMRYVRQTDEVPGLMGRDEPTAAFEYSVQPFSLAARIRPQETRLRIEADYVILLGANEAQLRATLKGSIRGAKISSLEIDAPGWDIESVGPDDLVDMDDLATGQNSPLVIPLRRATAGEVQLTLSARQTIDAGSGTVSLRVPVPHGQSIAPADVTVVPDDNIELQLQSDQTSDLVVQPLRPKELDLPARQQESLYFRTTGSAPLLVASAQVRKQEISASMATRLTIDERETAVDEHMTFQVAYEPTEQLQIGLPRGLRAETLTITLDGQRITPTAATNRNGDGSATAVTPLRLPLSEPRIGRCELIIKYAVPHDALPNQASSLVNVPLVVPTEGELTANELTVATVAGIAVTSPKGPWTAVTRSPRAGEAAQLVLSATSALPQVALGVSLKERRRDDATTIEQAWIQTALSAGRRHDRAFYRLITSEPSLRLLLPEGAELGSLELAVDGRRVRHELDLQNPGRELIVPLGSAASGQRTLEVRYDFNQRPSRGRLSLDPPRIQSAGWIRQLYWQLTLPPTEHLVGAPADFAREYRWLWSGLFWQREPALSDRELQEWIGAAPATSGVFAGGSGSRAVASSAPASAAVNRYLFSAVGAPTALSTYTMGRAWLVLFASLVILSVGLLLIYLPVVRHPATLLIGAVSVAALGLVDPELAVLVAQAASLGLLLAALAFIMARVSLRPAVPTVPVRGSSRAMERPYTEVFPRSAANSSQPSTATNPLLSTPTPESPS